MDKRTNTLSVACPSWYRLRYSVDPRRLADMCGITHLYPVSPSDNGFVDISEAGNLVIEMKNDGTTLTLFSGNSAHLGVSVEKIGQQIARFLDILFEQHAMYEDYL